MSLESLSATTVFFTLLSASIHSAALWYFHLVSDDLRSNTIVEGVPDTLTESAKLHIEFLQSLRRRGCRFDAELVQTVEAIVSLLCRPEGLSVLALGDALFTLSHYRWRGSGSGIIKLTTVGAACEWNHGSVNWQCPLFIPSAASTNDGDMKRKAILAICDPAARVCQSGYFDLSISVALSQTSSSGAQQELQPLSYHLGITLSGPNNQSFRRCKLFPL